MSTDWTSEYPTKPGFYWIRDYLHYGKRYSKRTIVEIIEETATLSGKPELRFYFLGDDMFYPLATIDQAEWQGPIEPDEQGVDDAVTSFRSIELRCKDCGKGPGGPIHQQDGEGFVYWKLDELNSNPVFGVICRQCWIKRLTPEQRKVYTV